MEQKKDNLFPEELRELINMGVSLSSEKELSNLLNMILEKSATRTQAETVNIYLVVEKAKQDTNHAISLQKESLLRFTKSYQRGGNFTDHNELFSINRQSSVGLAASNKEILNIFNHKEAEKENRGPKNTSKPDHHHKDQSLLIVPLVTADDQVRGVLELINKQDPKSQPPWNGKEKCNPL